MSKSALVQKSRPVPTALAPANIDYATQYLTRLVGLSSVLRLAYGLPEAEFAALLDQIEIQVTRVVLERLHG